MLRVGQECKAGLCCYAGVCYENTTAHFQSRNSERAAAPLSSCQAGPDPGGGTSAAWWASSQRCWPRRCVVQGCQVTPAKELLETPQEWLLPHGHQGGGGWGTADQQPPCQLFHLGCVHQTSPTCTTGSSEAAGTRHRAPRTRQAQTRVTGVGGRGHHGHGQPQAWSCAGSGRGEGPPWLGREGRSHQCGRSALPSPRLPSPSTVSLLIWGAAAGAQRRAAAPTRGCAEPGGQSWGGSVSPARLRGDVAPPTPTAPQGRRARAAPQSPGGAGGQLSPTAAQVQ